MNTSSGSCRGSGVPATTVDFLVSLRLALGCMRFAAIQKYSILLLIQIVIQDCDLAV
jgi:hypothetical protein